MKKFFCLLLSGSLICACVACSPTAPAEGTPAQEPTAAAETLTPAPSDETPGAASQTPVVSGETPQETSIGKDMASYGAPGISLEDYPVVDGSTATIPLGIALMQCATGISEEEADKLVEHTKTDSAYYNLVSEAADLLIVYAPSELTQEDLDLSNVKLDIAPIGLDALVFLANTGNPVTDLTEAQLVSIYSGKTKSWKDVGGEDKEIVAFQRPKQSGSQTLMEKLVMKNTPFAEPPSDRVVGAMGELIDEVSGYENTANALGYSVYYYVSEMYMQPGIKLLSVDGVMPSNDSIQSGDYPYVNEFYAVVRSADKTGPARELYNWLTTQGGQMLIEDTGYVPVE